MLKKNYSPLCLPKHEHLWEAYLRQEFFVCSLRFCYHGAELFVGGLGDTVAGALSEETGICIKKMAVKEVPRSGKAAELMERFGISANCIVKAVNSMLAE